MHLLFVHSLPIRARENPATVKHFEEDLKPHLGENTQQSLFRYALAQQLSLVMLVIVLMALLSEGGRSIVVVAGETVILSATAVILFVHIVPGMLLHGRK